MQGNLRYHLSTSYGAFEHKVKIGAIQQCRIITEREVTSGNGLVRAISSMLNLVNRLGVWPGTAIYIRD